MPIPAPVPAKKALRVLVVDDEPGILRMFRTALGNYGYRVEVASTKREALETLQQGEFDAVVSDVNLANENGIDFLREAHARNPRVAVILMTGRPTAIDARTAMAYGALRYLVKPVMPATLRDILEAAARA